MKLAAAVVLAVLAHAPLVASAQVPSAPQAGVAPPAPAQPPAWMPAAQPQRASTLYVNLRGGMYQPRGEDEGDIFNNGIDLGAAVGVQVHPNVALEGGIGYYRASSDRVTLTDGIDTISAKLNLSAIPITASVRLAAPVGTVTFSALAGVGLHMAELEAELQDSSGLDISGSESDTAFGFHLGGGVAVRVSERASVGAELRYTFAEATFADLDTKLDGLQLGAVLSFRL